MYSVLNLFWVATPHRRGVGMGVACVSPFSRRPVFPGDVVSLSWVAVPLLETNTNKQIVSSSVVFPKSQLTHSSRDAFAVPSPWLVTSLAFLSFLREVA